MTGTRRHLLIPVLATAVLSAGALKAEPPSQGFVAEGVWRNPRDSVHIELKSCGEQVCGYVVWASERAKTVARRAGPIPLVGRQLMRDFVVGPDHIGRGKVLVPDLNATFSGTAERTGPNTLKARGCLLGGVLCKSQIWTRIDAGSG